MEHLLRLARSNAALYAVALLFTLGVILWLAWARFFQEREGLKRVSHFVMALSVLVLFVGGYASVATNGLDGVACTGGRYSLHLECYSHDEHPWVFWAIVVLKSYFVGLFMVLALVVMVRLAMPGGLGAAAAGRHLRRADVTDAKLPVARKARDGGAFRMLQFMVGGMAAMTLAWIAMSLNRVDAVRKQVADAFASVAFERGTVETYLQNHGRLPDDNEAAALPPPAELHRRNLSEVEVVEGSLLLTFDAATADAHLAGRHVLLMAGRRGGQVHWQCATVDVDNRYLPLHCSANL